MHKFNKIRSTFMRQLAEQNITQMRVTELSHDKMA